MQAYGFPWPPMLDCDKFPLDNDMCITAQVMIMIMMMIVMIMMMIRVCGDPRSRAQQETGRQCSTASRPKVRIPEYLEYRYY